MNERLKELAEHAGLDAKEIREDGSETLYAFENFDIERFAELIRQDEREANAKLAEITCCKCMGTAEAIRAKGEQA